ncbi:MAG: CBS domain-containing protein [Gemmatimonadetes bacterium]|uniref:CBS domain-containing protein n=1 Tax=Candidatus Kutchimonas denitrificans TaxID=3056748 RepID=A0AAE4Z9S9_9BACT|nr:CBS domain-containing protein [Gemmatimonadota bacterium]NIR76419.1 CBS domain-containing protein [Candidatus Kutchimonas denitrificans]NIS03238.1 CBS domain-containing protein [Gemmatimonadota bacterium]NIT69099.1 CBS domain-containing protein [Gemmatimonadota bacterium]NIU54491.1 CBS domain-containing protein [Gemmatimonadota bacterium]
MSALRALLVWLRAAHRRFRQTEQLYMVAVATFVGLFGGLGAVAFRALIVWVNQVAWRQGPVTLDHLAGLPPWWKVAAPAVGGLFVGLITYRFAREARGHGVPEVMEAVALRGGRIRPRVVLAKLFASGICIGSGGSVGREGPIVQIGSALGSTIGGWLKIDRRRLRTLVGCGAAAGIAGTFNAPVAGALFAVEVILGDFGVAQFSPIVISSVAATVVSHYFLGDVPAFEIPAYSLVHASELFAYAGLGVLAGLVGLGFVRTLYKMEDAFERLPAPFAAKAVLGGALVGVIGIWAPQVFGVGYDAITEALHGGMAWSFLLALVVLKVLAVSITIGSGGSGGIFAPSLFIGAMLGGAVGTVITTIWPTATAGPGAYALVGMGAIVAAATHAPITAILIIFELTGDYEIILPLMISCIIATLLATRLQRASIYTMKLLRRGVDVHRGRAINVLQHVFAREVMRRDFVTVPADSPLNAIISRFVDHPGSTLFVVDEEDRLEGVITAEEIRPVMRDPAAFESFIIAEDVMVEGQFPTVSADDPLADVMKFLGTYRGEVPVMEDGRMVGVIWPEDVIARYNTEVFKRDMAGSMAAAVSPPSSTGAMPAAGDAVVAELSVPSSFHGRSIRDLNIRQAYSATVLMIKQTKIDGRETIITSIDPDYAFSPGDIMLVLAPEENIRRLRAAAGQ